MDVVKEAMFEAGAGKFGGYERCAFQIKGQGQFRPLPGSQPYLGTPNQDAFVEEVKVEMVCEEAALKKALDALKKAHPYEQPAYGTLKLH